MMEYKGYVGKVEFDDEAGIFHGEVLDTRDVITFQGRSVDELKTAFQESIDDYLAFCKQRGEEPNKPFSGQFVTRIPPELHRQVNLAASISGKSLNAWVVEQLQAAVARIKSIKAAKATGKGKGSRNGLRNTLDDFWKRETPALVFSAAWTREIGIWEIGREIGVSRLCRLAALGSSTKMELGLGSVCLEAGVG